MKTLPITNVAYFGANFNASKKQATEKTAKPQQRNNRMSSMSNVLCDKNYGVLQAKNMKVSFKGLPNVPSGPSLNAVSKKVNTLFNYLKTNDVVVAAPSYSHAVKSLKEHSDSFKTVIKRVFFVEEKNLDRAIGFRKNLEDREVVNLSKKPLMIKDSKNRMDFIREGEHAYLLDGDKVNAGKHEISIKDDAEVLPIKESFTHFFSADKEVTPKISEINKKTIEKMVPENEKKAAPKKVMFADVGGMDGVIKELKKNIIFPIKHPEIKNGKNMQKSILLYGPPGTGKSYVAEAAANEAGAWFKKVNASELDSKYVGESEENWRNLFKEAKENQPALIFIDEIDAIAKKRNGQDVYGDKTLNTILGLMSDSEKNGDQIYMLAATNRANMLDDAVTRSGRFGISIEVPAPDKKGVKDILKIYTKNEPMAKDFDADKAADKLYKAKATGADIAAATEGARSEALEREHIFEKMDNGTYVPEDMAKLTIKNEDFDKAIDALKKNTKTDKKAERNPIGFTSPIYQ